MSGEYHDHAIKMRDKLNATSSSLCLAKWLQVSLHLPQGLTQSCYHPPTHKIDINEIKKTPAALHNTKQKISERQMMISGQRPEGCSYCWRIEDASSDDPNGHLSDRHYRSSEWWAAPDFENIIDNPLDKLIKPRYVEVNFNQACNFKCVYCSPHLSSTWQEEIEQFGSIKLVDGKEHNNITGLENMGMMPLKVANKDNPFVEAFWHWWPEIYRNLRVFRMTGGEPLMDRNTFRVLEYINQNPHGQLELSITSNFCPPDQRLFTKFVELISNCEQIRTYEDKENFNPNSGNHWYVAPAYKHFMLFVSLDAVGKQAEYIRHGLNYDRLQNNIREFLSRTRHTSITFINTFNLLSLPTLKDFLTMVLKLREEFGGKNQKEFEIACPPSYGINHPPYQHKKFQRIWFDIPILRYPPWLYVGNLGQYGIDIVESCIEYMEQNIQQVDYSDTFEGFKPYEVLKVKRDLAIMRESQPPEQLIVNKRDFYLFIQELDKRRSKDFPTTFPQLTNYYKDCRGLINNV